MQFEHWSLPIIGCALTQPATRLSEFREALSIDPVELDSRLSDLVTSGLMEMDADDGDAADPIFRLTDKGNDLSEIIDAIDAWSDRWALPVPAPAMLTLESDAAPEDAPPLVEILLLGAFVLRVGGTIIGGLSVGSQRLLAFLALHDRAVTRLAIAGTMWPDASEERAGVSLRSALSRLDPVSRQGILVASAGLGLIGSVQVDFRQAQSLARRVIVADRSLADGDMDGDALETLSHELLPDWYDDWVIAEAEDWRQLRMNALEVLALAHLHSGRYAQSAAAARAAMKVEPLKESAHAILIQMHLAMGNQSEALRVYERYSDLLRSALDLAPTSHLSELVTAIQRS